jgi:hypothetical protein
MVYMAAGDNGELDGYAVRDIREMEKVGRNAALNIVVQINRAWPASPQRYRVNLKKQDSELRLPEAAPPAVRGARTKKVKGDPTNMGREETLREFLWWARKEAPAEHYLLVLWGHAYGLGFGRDHGDALTLPELSSVLADFRDTHPAGRRRPLELLGANSCAMSYAEAAFQFREVAKYLVASQTMVPFTGWPYLSILSQVRAETTPEQLGAIIVEQYAQSYRTAIDREKVAMTMLNLGRAEALGKGVSELAAALVGATRLRPLLEVARDAFTDAASRDVRPLIDLVDLCDQLERVFVLGQTPKAWLPVQAAASALRTLIAPDGYDAEPGSGSVLDATQLVVRHMGDRTLGRLHGIGIFAPFVTHERDRKRLKLSERGYRALDLTRSRTGWRGLVYSTLPPPVNLEVAALVDSSGSAMPRDRAAVAQLYIGIYRSFCRLEHALDGAKKEIARALWPSTSNQDRSLFQPQGPLGLLGPPLLRLARDRRPTGSAPNGPTASTLAGTGESGAAASRRDDASGAGSSGAAAPLFKSLALSFHQLEEAVAAAEYMTRTALVNPEYGLGAGDARFGLGAGDVKFGFGAGDVKFGFGAGDVKFGFGAGDVKFGFGAGDVKFGFGAGDVKFGFGAAARMLAADNVTQLFAQVALAFRRLEDAVAILEDTTIELLTDTNLSALGDRAGAVVRKRLERTLRDVEEALAAVQRTVSVVLDDSTHGLGPEYGVPSLGAAERHALASAGGMGPALLRLA